MSDHCCKGNGCSRGNKDGDDVSCATATSTKVIAAAAAAAECAAAPRHRFWGTQPVLQLNETVCSAGAHQPIEERDVSEIRTSTYALPGGFEWSEVSLEDEKELDELHQLLAKNYVEDVDSAIRFGYTKETLKWALKPPGWRKEWHVGVRASVSRKLLAFIGAIPIRLFVHKREIEMVEINFLCVIRKLRSRRLAPMLIREITRRCNLCGIHQALYTGGAVLPGLVARVPYHHRSLNWPKLVSIGFSKPHRNDTPIRIDRRLWLPDNPRLHGIRPMQQTDANQVTARLNSFLDRFDMAPRFTEQDVLYWFTPQDKVIHAYVVENSGGAITHFVSFFSAPSTVLRNPDHDTLETAYAFYYFYPRTETPSRQGENERALKALMQDALVFAKALGFDVFNCLDLMDNGLFMDDLMFAMGDGSLSFYLFNWRCEKIESSKLGVILI